VQEEFAMLVLAHAAALMTVLATPFPDESI